MAKKLQRILSVFFKVLLTKWIEDLFILAGLCVIVGKTYTLNPTLATYLIGFILLIFGLLMARK